MASAKSIREVNDIDVKWPAEMLVDSIGFQTKAGNRIKDYLNQQGAVKTSLRDLMGLLLPPASCTYKRDEDFWRSIPILRQAQFGPYLYDSALLTLTEGDLGAAFEAEWMKRIYSLKLHELRHLPANKRFQQTANSRGC